MIVCPADKIEISSSEQTKFAVFVSRSTKIIIVQPLDENRFCLPGGRNLNFHPPGRRNL